MFDDMDYPKPHDVAHMAFGAVLASMAPTGGSATGSAKSGPGEWASIDVAKDKAYHIMRAFRHGTETDPNGETDEEHLMKMITRAAMELAILRAEKAQKGT